MKLDFHTGIQYANAILKNVRASVSRLKIEDLSFFHVESYTNCREQGYAIIGSIYPKDGTPRHFYCAFSVGRNSDSAVVYLATYQSSRDSKVPTFESHQVFCGNIPSDEVYRKGSSFTYEKCKSHITNSSKFIVDELEFFVSDEFAKSNYFFTEQDAIIQKNQKAA
jgi:hypothetical protein